MDPLKEPSENQFQEIDLLDFIRVVKKRRKIIFTLSLLGLISGIFWYFWAPSNYQGMIIFKVGESENVKEIAEGLKKGIYDHFPKLELINPPGTNLLEINITSQEYNQTKTFLEKIKTNILSFHNQKANKKIETINQEISFLESKIAEFKKDISHFLTPIEQIISLKLEIYRMEKQIQDLEKEKNNISLTKVIKGPEIREKRPGYLSIFFAAVLGFFLGLILAAFSDWWEKNKEKI